MPSLTTEQIELEIERPNVTGVFVEDVIALGTPGGGTAQLAQGFVNFQNAVQQFEDAFEIIPNFFMKLLPSLQSEFTQNMTVNVALTILENIFQATNTVEVLPSVEATAIILPYGITFCNPNNAPQPTESSSVSSNQVNVNASVQIEEGMCIPPFNLLADGISTTYGITNEMEPTIADVLLGKPQITNSMTSPQMLSDSVSVSVSFQSSPPSTETITYYTPVDVANTYVIQVQQAYYSGQLNYSVSGS